MGWSFPWVSSHRSTFNFDFGVSLTPEQVASGDVGDNYGTTPYAHAELHRLSVFNNLPGEMKVTIEFEAVSCGTDLRITQEGIPAVIPADACYHGWGQSLELLTRLAEHTTPDEV